MKKRILALALCLVMVVSLLPITAAAQEDPVITRVCVTGNGFEKGADDTYVLKDGSWTVAVDDGAEVSSHFTGSTVGLYTDAGLTVPVTDDPADVGTFYLKYVLTTHTDYIAWHENPNCSLEIPGYSTAYINHDYSHYGDKGSATCHYYITFRVTKIHEHSWLFDHQGNSLTATCQNAGCPYGEVGVTLTAHSVTLPESPFNAKWETKGDFKEAFPNAQIYGPYYFYKESGGYTQVYENTFTPKAGEYQAQVYIYGLPGNEVAESGAFSTDDGTELGGGHLDLWVDYTAVDPAVTAQTGDNRPIEIMMISAAVFSVLAAAAFILDSKRKYSR